MINAQGRLEGWQTRLREALENFLVMHLEHSETLTFICIQVL